jgi:hypothetical protein
MSRCEEINAEMSRRHPGKTLKTMMLENPITSEQGRADSGVRDELKAQLSKIEAKCETIGGYSKRCPEEVSLSGTTEGHRADGEKIKSCSGEAGKDLGYSTRCPQGVSLSGTTEGHCADGEKINSCSGEDEQYVGRL